MEVTLNDALSHFRRTQMTSTQRINTQQLTITDTISKCLVVIFLKKMSADVATTKYMDTLLGVSTESIRQVKPFSIADQNITVIFVEMCDTRLASFVYNQWKSNNTDQTVTLYTASEYLCNVAAKKFQEPSFNNPGSAFHALFKPSALSALMFQQPQTVSVQVQSNTAPVQQSSNNHFQFNTRPQAQQFRPPSFNNVFTSVAAPGPSYPLSAPIQQYNYSTHVSMPQTYNPSIPTSMFDQSLNSPYIVQQPQQQQQQQYPQNSYFNFPPNSVYDASNYMYPNNQNGFL